MWDFSECVIVIVIVVRPCTLGSHGVFDSRPFAAPLIPSGCFGWAKHSLWTSIVGACGEVDCVAGHVELHFLQVDGALHFCIVDVASLVTLLEVPG